MNHRLLISIVSVLAISYTGVAQEPSESPVNIYINGAFGLEAGNRSGGWDVGFRKNDLRLEIRGQLTPKLFYRVRNCINPDFSQTLDLGYLGWTFTPGWTLYGGKVLQAWGGYEYDAIPIYIYEFCEYVSNMDCFPPGVFISCNRIKGQEFMFSLTDTHTKPLPAGFTPSKTPITAVLNWNGTLFDGLIGTRWGIGSQIIAQGEYAHRICLGTRLQKEKFQWYVDFYSSWETLDISGIIFEETGTRMRDVRYLSLVSRADWQPSPHFNLVLKGRLENAAMLGNGGYSRLTGGLIASVEYLPLEDLDFRLFASCNLRFQGYDDCLFRLGFICRLRAFSL